MRTKPKASTASPGLPNWLNSQEAVTLGRLYISSGPAFFLCLGLRIWRSEVPPPLLGSDCGQF